MLRSRQLIASVPKFIKRDVSTNICALQKASDPIQQLFLDKIREYKQKSTGGKLVDATPELLKERESELEKLQVQYGGSKGVDMSTLPPFKFEDPPVDVGLDKK